MHFPNDSQECFHFLSKYIGVLVIALQELMIQKGVGHTQLLVSLPVGRVMYYTSLSVPYSALAD